MKPQRYLILAAVLTGFVILYLQLNVHHGPSNNSNGSSNGGPPILMAGPRLKSSSNENAANGGGGGDDGAGPAVPAGDTSLLHRNGGKCGSIPASPIELRGQSPAARKAIAAANCPTCRSWTSFMSFRSRHQCRPVLESIAQVAPYDLKQMHKRDTKNVMANKGEKEMKRRRNMLKDRRPSAPFVTGDGFRAAAEFIFDEVTVPTWDKLNLKTQLPDKVRKLFGQQCYKLWVHDVGLIQQDEQQEGGEQQQQKNNDNEAGGAGEDPTKLMHDPPDAYHSFRMYRPSPRSTHVGSRKDYWKSRTEQVVRLTEDAAILNYNGVLPYLRFDCVNFGSPIFVQTHYLEKFIDEVLPIIEKRLDVMIACEKERITGDGRHCTHRRIHEDASWAIPQFVLITHNSDYSSPFDSTNTRGVKSDPSKAKFEKQITRLLQSPTLLRWFGQNMVLDPKRQRDLLERLEKSNNNPATLPPLPFELLDEEKKVRAELAEKIRGLPHISEQQWAKGKEPGRALEREEKREAKRRNDPQFHYSDKQRQQFIEKYSGDNDDEWNAQFDLNSAARRVVEREHNVDLALLEQQKKHPRRDAVSAEHIAAKLIPIPIGIENRYNRYGAFVDREYAAAAGCYHKDAILFDGGRNPDSVNFWEKQEREMATKFDEELATLPREVSRPFVSFSVKTNKREREEAIAAVAENFNTNNNNENEVQLPSLSSAELDKCVAHMTSQMNSVVNFIEKARRMAAEHKRSAHGAFGNDAGEIPQQQQQDRSSNNVDPKVAKYQQQLRSFLAKLKCHGFTMAPHGHGVDTHRLWEALYAGSVPIASTSPYDDQLLRQLPVLLAGRRNSPYYESGTYRDLLKPRVLQQFWCNAAKGSVASRLRWHDFEEPKVWRDHDNREGYRRALAHFFNESQSLPRRELESFESLPAEALTDMRAEFVPEFLDMSFWAHVITQPGHPTMSQKDDD